MANTTPRHSQLDQILAQAIEQGATSVELERASGSGLEVTFITGEVGVGMILPKQQEQPTIDDLLQRLGNRPKGNFKVQTEGEEVAVKVTNHDSFGETAYRLTFPASNP